MKEKEKKMLLKHLNKDDKEFKSQLKDDLKLKKNILSNKSSKKR